MINVAWQPSARRGQPGGAALTGPPTAALTGRAASRAERRWRHTAEPPGGRMGEARRSDRSSALPSPRGASQAALDQFGPQHLVELTTLMGHYAQTAFILNAFAVELPAERTEKVLPVG
jgi:hypothetical protein